MKANYTPIIQQHGEWWIGWVEEIPGVNSQGRTREELLENLRNALEEALAMNQAEAQAGQPRPFGLCADQFTVPADFDQHLPEDVLKEFEGS